MTSEKFTSLRNQLYGLLHDEIRKAVIESAASERAARGKAATAGVMSGRSQARSQQAREPRACRSPSSSRSSCSGISAPAYGRISPILLPNPVAVWHELNDVLRTRRVHRPTCA